MARYSEFSLRLAFLALSAVMAVPLQAEIYKWVDAQGNVHFGDKPRTPEQAVDAQPVELRESYKPAQRTAQEQEAWDREQALIQRRTETRRRIEEDDRKTAQAETSEKKKQLCAAYREDLRRLTSMDIVDGRRTTYYATTEDGKSVSSQRQREIAEEIRTAMSDAGCT